MIIRHGDCIAEMSAMLDEGVRVDAVVCDPPYELGFMGKGWDSTGIANRMETWLLAFELLKPGGHLLAFSGTRTQHRMVCAIEDAGFEIRDQIGWLYGTGFPKSLDVSKAIDKAAGAEREVVGRYQPPNGTAWNLENDTARSEVGAVGHSNRAASLAITAPATDAARQWAGWGTALKPAWEPICVARKPLDGTVAANVLEHGTGALNIDGCRIPGEKQTPWGKPSEVRASTGWGMAEPDLASDGRNPNIGRWPANVLHDGSGEVLEAFAQFGEKTSGSGRKRGQGFHNCLGRPDRPQGDKDKVFAGDTGTAARFFYSAKASKADRAGSAHPTVKPISLMRYLCRLACPPAGLILDPFAGSGTTLEAAALEGFRCIGIEREAEYVADIRRRLERTRADLGLFAAE